jgi:hypothetical protein
MMMQPVRLHRNTRMMHQVQPKAQRRGQMTQPSVRRADLFSRVRILLSTSLLAGVPVHVVSQRPGHANATISLLVYAHVMPGSQREAADLFARLVGVPRHDPGAASIRLASRGYSERGSHRRNSADLHTRWDDHGVRGGSAPKTQCVLPGEFAVQGR